MNEGLNLLPSMAKFQAAKIKLKKRISFIMGVFLVCWILVVVIVFGWFWFESYLLKKAESKNTVALNKYKSLATNVVLSKKNKYQAKLVGQVLNERVEYGSLIGKITNLFSQNVVLESFDIPDKKRVVLEGFLEDGADMDEVEGKVEDINLGLYSDFKSAKLNSLDIKSEGWKFEAEINLI